MKVPSVLHGHPDAERDGLRRVLLDGTPVLTIARGGDLFALTESLRDLLAAGRARVLNAVEHALDGAPLTAAATLLAPVDAQEVWASGVTYRRSASARERESVVADVYTLVYEAERPELFLKATPGRVPPPGAPLRIRADSGWDVPEPELALVLDAQAQIVGFLVADDVSSRAIEGANPLYLPQAKIYDDSLGLSGTIVLASEEDAAIHSAAIELVVRRSGEVVFTGSTSVTEMRRSFDELGEALFRELSHPAGAVLLTGTGIVPPDDFALAPRDEVRISIEGVGVLAHDIYRQEARKACPRR